MHTNQYPTQPLVTSPGMLCIAIATAIDMPTSGEDMYLHHIARAGSARSPYATGTAALQLLGGVTNGLRPRRTCCSLLGQQAQSTGALP